MKKPVFNYKIINGEEVFPVLFDGKNQGKGKYMAATTKTAMLLDSNGNPLPYKDA